MKKQNISFIIIFLVILIVGMLLESCGSNTPTSSSSGDGQTLMQGRCSVCHSLDRVLSAHKTTDQWTVTVQRMVSHGAQLTAQEQQTLIEYLAANYK